MTHPNRGVADLPQLLARLDQIEAACREERWDEAESLMIEHDTALRAVPPASWRTEILSQLIERQQQLAGVMRDARDAAAAELSQFGASKRGAQAYRK